MNYVVVAYYTYDTLYEDKVKTLQASLESFAIPNVIEGISNLGSWNKNTCHKPTFIKHMMIKYRDKNIVYVDCDAEFFRYPILFDTLDCNIGVHVFDRLLYRRKGVEGTEVLSGTIFLKNNQEVFDLVSNWEAECKRNPSVWDQKSLQKILRKKGDNYYYNLPPEYCKIFDRMTDVSDPVIVHYQCSRIVRKNKGSLISDSMEQPSLSKS